MSYQIEKPSVRNLVKALRHTLYCKVRLIERRGPRGGRLPPYCDRCEKIKMDFLWNPAMERYMRPSVKPKANVIQFNREARHET